MHGPSPPGDFPPWYFWFFIFCIVVVVMTGAAWMVVRITAAESARRVKERELAAALLTTLIKEHSLAPSEIERLMDCYWQLGSQWHRFWQLWSPRFSHLSIAKHESEYNAKERK